MVRSVRYMSRFGLVGFWLSWEWDGQARESYSLRLLVLGVFFGRCGGRHPKLDAVLQRSSVDPHLFVDVFLLQQSVQDPGSTSGEADIFMVTSFLSNKKGPEKFKRPSYLLFQFILIQRMKNPKTLRKGL